MGAAEKSERGIIKCLHPQRQPRNAGLAQLLHMRRRSADRICFQRYFSLRGEPPESVNMVQNIADQFSRHKRWRAAAKKYGFHRPVRAQPMRMGQLATIGGQPIFLCRRVFMRRVNIEIAIGTNRRTKRPMQINAQGRHIGLAFGWPVHASLSSKQAATNWAKASARCDMACLASGSISPKVKSPPSGRKIGS